MIHSLIGAVWLCRTKASEPRTDSLVADDRSHHWRSRRRSSGPVRRPAARPPALASSGGLGRKIISHLLVDRSMPVTAGALRRRVSVRERTDGLAGCYVAAGVEDGIRADGRLRAHPRQGGMRAYDDRAVTHLTAVEAGVGPDDHLRADRRRAEQLGAGEDPQSRPRVTSASSQVVGGSTMVTPSRIQRRQTLALSSAPRVASCTRSLTPSVCHRSSMTWRGPGARTPGRCARHR